METKARLVAAGAGKLERGSRAQIVGHPLQPLKKIQPRQPQAANQREDGESQKNRRAFEGLEFHRIGLNKKPEQLKAALVTLQKLRPAGCQNVALAVNQNGHAG